MVGGRPMGVKSLADDDDDDGPLAESHHGVQSQFFFVKGRQSASRGAVTNDSSKWQSMHCVCARLFQR